MYLPAIETAYQITKVNKGDGGQPNSLEYIILNGNPPYPINTNIEDFKNEFLYTSPIAIKQFEGRYVELPASSPLSTVESSSSQAEKTVVSQVPIASKYEGVEVYNIGPAARLALTPAEIEQSEALAKINENTAALFRYGGNTAKLVAGLAQQDLENGFERRTREDMQPRVEVIELPRLPKQAEFGETLPYYIDQNELVGLPNTQNSRDMLSYVTAERLHNYRFPENLPEIQINLRPSQITSESVQFAISFSPNINASPEYQSAFYDLFQDASFKNIIARAVKNKPNGQVSITIPFNQGMVDTQGVGMRIS